MCDMMIGWENEEMTSKPPALIATDDPVTCTKINVMIEYENGPPCNCSPPKLVTQLLIS